MINKYYRTPIKLGKIKIFRNRAAFRNIYKKIYHLLSLSLCKWMHGSCPLNVMLWKDSLDSSPYTHSCVHGRVVLKHRASLHV